MNCCKMFLAFTISTTVADGWAFLLMKLGLTEIIAAYTFCVLATFLSVPIYYELKKWKRVV